MFLIVSLNYHLSMSLELWIAHKYALWSCRLTQFGETHSLDICKREDHHWYLRERASFWTWDHSRQDPSCQISPADGDQHRPLSVAVPPAHLRSCGRTAPTLPPVSLFPPDRTCRHRRRLPPTQRCCWSPPSRWRSQRSCSCRPCSWSRRMLVPPTPCLRWTPHCDLCLRGGPMSAEKNSHNILYYEIGDDVISISWVGIFLPFKMKRWANNKIEKVKYLFFIRYIR